MRRKEIISNDSGNELICLLEAILRLYEHRGENVKAMRLTSMGINFSFKKLH